MDLGLKFNLLNIGRCYIGPNPSTVGNPGGAKSRNPPRPDVRNPGNRRTASRPFGYLGIRVSEKGNGADYHPNSRPQIRSFPPAICPPVNLDGVVPPNNLARVENPLSCCNAALYAIRKRYVWKGKYDPPYPDKEVWRPVWVYPKR